MTESGLFKHPLRVLVSEVRNMLTRLANVSDIRGVGSRKTLAGSFPKSEIVRTRPAKSPVPFPRAELNLN